LTINALAYDLKNKTIIDEFGGMQDLEDKIIRAVGQPEDRFQEDYSRMLRAIRFACRFDFDIEKNTWQAIQKLMTNINKTRINEKNKKEYIVPRETISKELLKTFKANPAKAMELLDQSGAFKQLMPEVLKMKGCEQPIDFHSEGDVWQHTKMMLEKIKSTEFKNQFPNTRISGEFVLGCLLHDAGKPESRQVVDNDVNFHGHDKKSVEIAKKIGRRLNLSNDQKEKITFMAQHHMFLMMVENIFKVSPNKVASRFIDSPHSKDLLMLFYLDSASSVRPDGSLPMKNFHDTLKRIKEIKEIRANQPKKIISGKKIIQTLEINPGPFIGIIIQTISELADQGKINNAKQAENFIKKNKKLLNSYQEKIAKMSKITTVKKDKLVTEILNKL